MSKGPRGEKRPADVIGNAVKVMRIATGEETEELETDRAKSAAAELGSRGGKARAANMTSERRSEIARAAAQVSIRSIGAAPAMQPHNRAGGCDSPKTPSTVLI
jgi:general stress protein YciG